MPLAWNKLTLKSFVYLQLPLARPTPPTTNHINPWDMSKHGATNYTNNLSDTDHSIYKLKRASSISSVESLGTAQEFIETQLPLLDFAVSHDDLLASARTLIALAFPSWEPQDIALEQYKDGVTNKLLRCTNIKTHTTVLIKTYGRNTENIIDRVQELQTFVAFASQHLCPPVHARFQNGFIYGYVDGRPLSPEELRNRHISKLIATKIAKWHCIEIPGVKKPKLFKIMRRWLKDIPKQYTNPQMQKIFVERIDVGWIKDQIHDLEAVLTKSKCPIVFCHNDLLSANIIYDHVKDDVSFIDFEYGCWNYQNYDIGNHFCEFAGFACDYSKYPSKEEQFQWLSQYLAAYTNRPVADTDLQKMYVEVNWFAMASHLFWGLWGLIQAEHSDIDFDYISYAVLRFGQLKAMKQTWFERKVSETDNEFD